MQSELETYIKKLTIGKSAAFYKDKERKSQIMLLISVCLFAKKMAVKSGITSLKGMQNPFNEELPRKETFSFLCDMAASKVAKARLEEFYENLFFTQFSKDIKNDFDMYCDYVIFLGISYVADESYSVDDLKDMYMSIVPMDEYKEFDKVTNYILHA